MGHRFELLGGDPALNFLNTIHDWTVPQQREYLSTPEEAARFGAAAGILSGSEADAGVSAGELRKLRDLRTLLERVLRPIVAGRVAEGPDLVALSEAAAAAGTAMRLRSSRGRLLRTLEPTLAGPSLLRWRLVESAVALLTSERLARVKACPACGWFFLDVSKNRSRRWCSMTNCGSLAKARAYYQRSRRRAGRARAHS